MKKIANLLSSLIIAAWVCAIAVFSVQNYTLVSLKFLTFTSVPMPFGVFLAFCFGTGMILGAVVPLFWGTSKSKKRRRTLPTRDRANDFDEDDPLENWS